MDEISIRNFLTLSEGLKQQRSTNSDQDEKIVKLEEMVAGLTQQVSVLTNQCASLIATRMGSGPTVK
jgi:hypothetical protein